MDGMITPIDSGSKIQRWQKKHRVFGQRISAKNMNPGPLSYKGQQWGAGSNNNAPVGRKNRFNGQTGPARLARSAH